MIKHYMSIKGEEGKTLAIMAVSACVEGKAVGRKEKGKHRHRKESD